jgi:hypothetical protein
VEVCHSTLDELSRSSAQELREVALLEWRPAEPDLAAGTVAVEFAFPGDCLRIIAMLCN